ncbi:MAG: hypothetical protein GX250_06015 [Clostridiales bacterium]|nr:hypothetical protein [Clostridiales bacterium]
MKKTDSATKFISVVLFLAVLCYFGFYLSSALLNPYSSTFAVRMTVQEGISVLGIAVRRETVIGSGGYGAVNLMLSEGERVEAGGVVAGVYNDESTLIKLREIDLLDAKITRLESMLEAGQGAQDMITLDSKIKNGIYMLVKEAHSRSFAELSETAAELEANILTRTVGDSEIQAKLLSLRQQRLALGSAGSTAVKIFAPVSGIFTSTVDGFEALTEEDLSSLTVGSLTALLEEERTPEASAIGKLVSGVRWYFAAVADAEDASRLTVGGTATMIFGKYAGSEIEMDIESIGLPEDGKCVVIFSSSKSMADTLTVRVQSVKIVYSDYSGIRVPKKAVRLNSEGKSCVYTLTGARAEEKLINIIYELDEYYIVESGENVQELRFGDEIITSTKGIYDGKIMK